MSNPWYHRGGVLRKEGSTHHLPRRHTHSLDRELPPAHVEQVLQAWAQEIDDEDIVQALLAEVVDLRDTGYIMRDGKGLGGSIE